MDVEVRGDHITLGQLVKLVGEVGSGGDVKAYLEQERVLVNGEQETRRGAKLRPGDSVVLKGTGLVRLISPETGPEHPAEQ